MNKGTTTARCTPASRTTEFRKAKDLRRRHGREAAEALVLRATWLPDCDRQLVLAVYEEGKSVIDLASLMKQPVRTLRARVRRLVERITSPIFAFVALNLDQWPMMLKRVAEACVVRGLTIKEASAELRISYYSVRRHLDLIRTMLETGTPGAAMSSWTSAPARARRGGDLPALKNQLHAGEAEDDDEDDETFGDRRDDDDPAEPERCEEEGRAGRHASSNGSGRLGR
ncbi:MAG: hypothetical protein H7210_01935 [Pyrinomonadaceae bacterium]|nr:hypothetical protein [Phycisphaerales bacterium]